MIIAVGREDFLDDSNSSGVLLFVDKRQNVKVRSSIRKLWPSSRIEPMSNAYSRRFFSLALYKVTYSIPITVTNAAEVLINQQVVSNLGLDGLAN